MESRRRNHYDVTNQICIADPHEVRDEVSRLLAAHDPLLDDGVLDAAFLTFTRLHAGALPGYAAADTLYHDAQHSLDCALGTARLIDGHERGVPAAERIGPRRALLGVLIALFHDSGYVRRRGDRASNGAAYTLSHVQRSAEFLQRFLPSFGFEQEAALAGRIVHFTGYEMPLDDIAVSDPRDRALGFMIASADLLVQTADRCYLEKCRDFLYPEFEVAGLAGPRQVGGPEPLYADRDTLMRGTPEFNARLWQDRLDGYFGGIHRHLGTHFEGRYGGRNPYRDCIDANLQRIARAIHRGRFDALSLRPKAIDAACMRRKLALSEQMAA
ncbi:hypothetical protein [uncultured Nevskia sp.]|uniref:hypothetical protein n=1 Tax=uncultured Nevskia sp. TaxID=228950 RepID=UPI0025D907DF|nr:hypothetical protein [uncultured Nevskia sp.]